MCLKAKEESERLRERKLLDHHKNLLFAFLSQLTYREHSKWGCRLRLNYFQDFHFYYYCVALV